MAGEERWSDVCTQVNSCALAGAAAFFAGIPDAAIVVNGPLWCGFYALKHLDKAFPDIGKRFFCTQPDNNAVVYGTEECLLDVLHSVKQSATPSVVLVENSCAVGLIGDDTAAIAAQAGFSCPVVCLDSGGLSGGFWEGYRLAAKAFFEAVPLENRSISLLHSVNLLGLGAGYYNGLNDVQELKRMLALAGYEVLACPGAFSSIKEIVSMTLAEMNIVIHDELGLQTAQYLKERYGIPYVLLKPPYGIEGTLDWFETLREIMWMRVDSLGPLHKEADGLKMQIKKATRDMQRIWGEPYFRETLIAAPSSVALGMAGTLHNEWVDTGSIVLVLHDGGLTCEKPAYVTEMLDGMSDGEAVEKCLFKINEGLVMASAQEKAVLNRLGKNGVVCHNISQPVYDEIVLDGHPFMGLRGSCRMIERLWNKYIQHLIAPLGGENRPDGLERIY